MKTWAFMLASLISVSVNAQSFMAAEGAYEGTGKYRTEDGDTGNYGITVQFAKKRVGQKDVLAMTSKSNDRGRSTGWEIYFADDRNGFFKVLDTNLKQIGEGYCLDYQCNFNVSSLFTYTQETFSFMGPHMYVLGMRSQAGKKSMWQEVLQRK